MCKNIEYHLLCTSKSCNWFTVSPTKLKNCMFCDSPMKPISLASSDTGTKYIKCSKCDSVDIRLVQSMNNIIKLQCNECEHQFSKTCDG